MKSLEFRSIHCGTDGRDVLAKKGGQKVVVSRGDLKSIIEKGVVPTIKVPVSDNRAKETENKEK